MKFNLEIDIDWIDEDSNLNDQVKEEIINTIIARVNNSIEKTIKPKIEEKIDGMIVEKIDSLISGIFSDFMDKEVNITDSYGDVITSHENVYAVIKSRFDKFMIQTVDDRGETSNGRYGGNQTRLHYIIDKQLKDFADDFTTNAVKQVSAEIKEHVKEGLTNKLGSELMNVLKVNDMLKIEG
jgi:hypothetical protein